MDRKFHTRLVTLVSVLAFVSMISVMITDLHFYWGKIRDKQIQEAAKSLPLIAGNYNCDQYHSIQFNPKHLEIQTEDNSKDDDLINNYGDNVNLHLDPDRQKNAGENELKYILFWNEAYGSKEYDLGFGRQPFFDNLCPETRCSATDNRTLMPVDKFDAVFFHQRSLDFNDIPEKRSVRIK